MVRRTQYQGAGFLDVLKKIGHFIKKEKVISKLAGLVSSGNSKYAGKAKTVGSIAKALGGARAPARPRRRRHATTFPGSKGSGLVLAGQGLRMAGQGCCSGRGLALAGQGLRMAGQGRRRVGRPRKKRATTTKTKTKRRVGRPRKEAGRPTRKKRAATTKRR